METKDIKKHFSKLGFILFIGTLLIYGVQFGAMTISEKIPVIADNPSLSFAVAMLPMYVIAFPLIFLMLKKVPAQTYAESKKMKPMHVLIAFLMTYALTYVCNIIGTVITTVIGMFKQSTVDNVLLDVTSSIHPLATFIIIAICAPIMEELLFRKYLVDRTIKYGEGVAIVFSGLVFGLFHGNLSQFSYAVTLGMFFAFIYIKTKKIVYTIILHMLQNFMGSVVGIFIMEKSGFMKLAEQLEGLTDDAEIMALMMENLAGIGIFFAYFALIMCFVIAGIVFWVLAIKKLKISAGEVQIEKGKRFNTVFLNIGTILYSLFWIVQIVLQLLQ